MAEYDRLSPEQEKALRKVLDAKQISEEFVRPHFENFTEFYMAYKGIPFPELDATFSKTMLHLAFSTIEQELPARVASLSTPNFFALEANEPHMEFSAEAAQKWLRYQVEK